MSDILKIIPIVFYLIVGLISFVMAINNIFAKKMLPFQEKAAGKLWNEIEKPVQFVILSLLRLAGLGFLIVSILLIVFPIMNYFYPNFFYKFSIPVISLVFCSGLFGINYLLYQKTKAETPWKGSLYAMILLLAGIILSIFN